jgi:hypothetical protein
VLDLIWNLFQDDDIERLRAVALGKCREMRSIAREVGA